MQSHEPATTRADQPGSVAGRQRPQHARTWDYGALGDGEHRIIADRVAQFFRVLDKLDRQYFPERYPGEDQGSHADSIRPSELGAGLKALAAPVGVSTGQPLPQQALPGGNVNGNGAASAPDEVNNHLLVLARLVAREMAGIPREPAPPPKDGRQLLEASDVANLMGISVRTVWRLISSGHVPQPIRIGGSPRWHRSTLENFVAAKIKEGERVSRRWG